MSERTPKGAPISPPIWARYGPRTACFAPGVHGYIPTKGFRQLATVVDVFEGPKAPNAGSTFAGLKGVVKTLTMSNSYTTGGEAIAEADFEFASGGFVFVTFGGASTGGYVPAWDKTNKKVMVFRQSAATGALTEVPNATNLSAEKFQILAIGIGN